MNVGINSSCCQDQSLPCQCFRGGTNDHPRCYPVHDLGISGLSDTGNFSVFNTYICLINSCGINDQCAGNDHVQTFFIGKRNGLSHTIPERFASAKFGFISIHAIILLHFHDQGSVCQPHPVSRSGTVHGRIFFSRNFLHTDFLLISL